MTEAAKVTNIDQVVNDTFFAGDSEMAALMRGKDWSQTPLGSITTWPQSLKTTIRILLTSRFAMWMGWGPELRFFYNDSYRPTLGIKHPQTLGIPADEVWAEIWKDIGPRIQHVLSTGEATWDEALLLLLERSGYTEETYHTFSYSPLADDSGNISGMLCVVTEETERVIGERRLALLRDVASTLASAQTIEEIFAALPQSFEANARDLPFSLIYLFEGEGNAAHLACSPGVPLGHPIASPHLRQESSDTPWPLPELLTDHGPVLIDNLDTLFTSPPSGPWDRPPKQAVLFPLMQQGQERSAGFLVAAINPYRPFDAAYQGFVGLLAGQLASSLANARAYEEEKRRTEELAKLDRAKTAFFSNVSHEFRTPLTLMLGPLDDLLTESEERLRTEQRESLTAVLRNGQRLLKLVNTLLDFTRIEAGRVQARYEPTDLATLTTELTSVFRSAVEKAGMRLLLSAPSLSEPVYVDRDMWEKIVLNLLSNAFKFTLEGEIEVRLEERDHHVLLSVRDTGTGIPADHLPHIFERFHRVEGRRARTHEGTGIGLALVQELVRLHGGTVGVESTPGIGTTFHVTIPLGRTHLPEEQIAPLTALSSTALSAEIFVEEALRWLPETPEGSPTDRSVQEETPLTQTMSESKDGRRPCVLLADDNADMRAYVGRLLRPHYEVIAVSDGLQALRIAEQRRPDLVLSDVMMPALDGFGLLQALRSNPYTASVPIILLSARAGEEARIEGLNAGADDYLIKPFSARELLARVASHIELSRVRREAEQAIRQSEIQLAAMNVRLQRAMTETHHRVKNNLQLISALIDMQQHGSEEMIPASELARLSSNVRALSVIHDILTMESKAGNDQESVSALAVLEKLTHVLQKTAGRRPLRYAFSDIRLPGRQATSLALVVNELVLNALKYGQGETAILFNVGTDTATLEILDDGPGFPRDFVPKQAANTGLELVENIVEWDLNGLTTFASRPEGGARITVTFPIPSSDPPFPDEV